MDIFYAVALSHVVVYLEGRRLICLKHLYFNTSHVVVYQRHQFREGH